MFYFIACLASDPGNVICTPPIVVESIAECAKLEAAYRKSARERFKPTLSVQCIPKDAPKP